MPTKMPKYPLFWQNQSAQNLSLFRNVFTAKRHRPFLPLFNGILSHKLKKAARIREETSGL